MDSIESEAIRLWFQAYEPAVDVEVTPGEIVMRSTRPGRQAVISCARRPRDLTADLDEALGRLVLELS